MLELITKTKWPLAIKAEVLLELSNGNSYKLFSHYGKLLEFKLVSSKSEVEFRFILKKRLKAFYEAFCNEQSILTIHSGIIDYLEIDNSQYRITGVFRNYVNAYNFYCATKPLLIGHELKAVFPETFEIQGVTLVSYIYVKNWLRRG